MGFIIRVYNKMYSKVKLFKVGLMLVQLHGASAQRERSVACGNGR